jgi:type IV secretory pathway VirB9-like protein
MEVFKDHEWIKPSESICERTLMYLGDSKAAAYKLELRLVAGTKGADPPAHHFVGIALPQKAAESNSDKNLTSAAFDQPREGEASDGRAATELGKGLRGDRTGEESIQERTRGSEED